jgi:hypothetical protein
MASLSAAARSINWTERLLVPKPCQNGVPFRAPFGPRSCCKTLGDRGFWHFQFVPKRCQIGPVLRLFSPLAGLRKVNNYGAFCLLYAEKRPFHPDFSAQKKPTVPSRCHDRLEVVVTQSFLTDPRSVFAGLDASEAPEFPRPTLRPIPAPFAPGSCPRPSFAECDPGACQACGHPADPCATPSE